MDTEDHGQWVGSNSRTIAAGARSSGRADPGGRDTSPLACAMLASNEGKGGTRRVLAMHASTDAAAGGRVRTHKQGNQGRDQANSAGRRF